MRKKQAGKAKCLTQEIPPALERKESISATSESAAKRPTGLHPGAASETGIKSANTSAERRAVQVESRASRDGSGAGAGRSSQRLRASPATSSGTSHP